MKPEIAPRNQIITVYKINCRICDAVYISVSSQYMKNKIKK